MVLALETPPWDSAYRALIGYGLMPAYFHLPGGNGAAWKLFVFFLAILVALRLVPGILRRVLPFSHGVKTVWADRRTLAKRYDSFQWRKLFGFGLGWFIYLRVSGESWTAARFLAGACLVAGALGLAFWHRQSRRLAAQASAAAPNPVSA
jgi:hypothetical protein